MSADTFLANYKEIDEALESSGYVYFRGSPSHVKIIGNRTIYCDAYPDDDYKHLYVMSAFLDSEDHEPNDMLYNDCVKLAIGSIAINGISEVLFLRWLENMEANARKIQEADKMKCGRK